MLFFLGFAEEISWGQRIFHIQTPEALAEINMQDEINIHNLNIFHGKTEDGQSKSFWGRLFEMERLFSLFWFSFCFVLPIVSLLNARIFGFLKKINIPIVPISLGVLFMINYLMSKIVETHILNDMQHYLVEMKESNISILILAVSIWFWYSNKKITNKHAEAI